MLSGPWLLLLAFSFVFGTAVSERKLVYVTVLFRHGDRSPIRAYPTDPYQESAWPQGFGQLSQVGMQQHFELGQFLRQRYTGFLNESYDRHEISVRSTDYDRTLMSAECNLAGLYPPNGSQVFNPKLNWQPIPVHTVPMNEDRLLLFPLSDCPRLQVLMNETKQTEQYLNVTSQYEDILELVKNKTGLSSVEAAWSVHDTLFCEAQHNMSAPDWVTPEIMEKLKFLKDFSFQVMFGIYKQKEKSRLQGGILLGEIVKNLTAMAAEDSKSRLKLKMLSAHDTTVAALQASLNVFSGVQPPYASCHIFELYKNESGSFSVSMYFRNYTTLYPLQLPGCAFDCPLEDFRNLTKPYISDDPDKECQLSSKGTDMVMIIGLAVIGAVLLLLIVILFGVLNWSKKLSSNMGYHHVLNEDES